MLLIAAGKVPALPPALLSCIRSHVPERRIHGNAIAIVNVAHAPFHAGRFIAVISLLIFHPPRIIAVKPRLVVSRKPRFRPHRQADSYNKNANHVSPESLRKALGHSVLLCRNPVRAKSNPVESYPEV